MKKIFIKLFIVLSLLFTLENVYAASASISIGTSTTQAIVGKNVTVSVTVSSGTPLGAWEYTLNYDSNIFRLASSDVDLHYAGYVSNNNTKSVTYKYVFSALKSGTGRFSIGGDYAVTDFDENIIGNVSVGSKSVKVITYAEYQSSLSSNNNLKSITVEGYEISPKFSKDVLEYTAQVSEDTKTVKVSAVAEDRTASVNGDGEIEVTQGANEISLTVVAQNGSEKVYKLVIEVIDKNPIEVTIDNEKYTVVKIKDKLETPKSFTENTVTINEIEIPSFYNEMLDITLVGLKDEEGKVSLFKYDNGNYEKYIEISDGGITIIPTKRENLKDYLETNFYIGNDSIEALEYAKNSRFKIINGINVESGEEGYFIYDTKDGSIMKYDDDIIEELMHKSKMLLYTAGAFMLTTVLAVIGIVISNKKKSKPQKAKTVEEEIPTEKVKPKKAKKEIPAEVEEIIESNNISEVSSEEMYYNIFEDDKVKKNKKKK